MKNYRLHAIKKGNIIYIVHESEMGTKEIIGAYIIPNDGKHMKDLEFYKGLEKIYNERLKQ